MTSGRLTPLRTANFRNFLAGEVVNHFGSSMNA
jgi:hypothetical protein